MNTEDKKAIQAYIKAATPNKYGLPVSIPDLNYLAIQASGAVERLLAELEELRYRMDGLEK